MPKNPRKKELLFKMEINKTKDKWVLHFESNKFKWDMPCDTAWEALDESMLAIMRVVRDEGVNL